MINLVCPSCGGKLDLPDNLEIAHCMYCGAKILLDEFKNSSNSNNLKQYIQLSKAAISAENYNEALDYCNKILEIDINNAEAWLAKAISCSNLAIKTNDRLKEAFSCIDKAFELKGNNKDIDETRNLIADKYINKFNEWGNEEYENAKDIYEMYHSRRSSSSNILISIAEDIAVNNEAKSQSINGFKKAMKLFLSAIELDPLKLRTLNNIAQCAGNNNWIDWGAKVNENLEIQKKVFAENRLVQLKNELQNAIKRRDKAKTTTESVSSFELFNPESEKSIEREIAILQNEIKQKEDYISSFNIS